jgi:hypothetical protein
VVIHGLNETSVLGKGPPFPAAWATKTPAFTAERRAASNGFKNVVRVADGGLLGPTERLSTSTPSSTACLEGKHRGHFCFNFKKKKIVSIQSSGS